MKILLQNKKTGVFLKEDDTWTLNIAEGYGFINSGKAIDYAFAHKLADVHLVLWFKELNHSLIVPFQREHREATGPPPKIKPREGEKR